MPHLASQARDGSLDAAHLRASLCPPLHPPQVISQKEGDFFFDSLRQVADWVKKNKPQKEGERRALWGRLGPERRGGAGKEKCCCVLERNSINKGMEGYTFIVRPRNTK